MTPSDEQLRALCERASPAPWQVYGEPEVGLPPSLFSGEVGQTGFGPIEPLSGYDLDLCAAARTAIPALLDRVAALECEIENALNAPTWPRCLAHLHAALQGEPK